MSQRSGTDANTEESIMQKPSTRSQVAKSMKEKTGTRTRTRGEVKSSRHRCHRDDCWFMFAITALRTLCRQARVTKMSYKASSLGQRAPERWTFLLSGIWATSRRHAGAPSCPQLPTFASILLAADRSTFCSPTSAQIRRGHGKYSATSDILLFSVPLTLYERP